MFGGDGQQQPSLQPQLLLQPQLQLLLQPQPQPQLLPPQLPPQQQNSTMMIRTIQMQLPLPPPQPLFPQHMICLTSLIESGSFYAPEGGVVPGGRSFFL